MSWKEKLKNELKSVGIATAYFLFCFGTLMLIKFLLLKEYQIEFSGVSMMVIGALTIAKVLLIMEHIPLGKWVNKQPAYLEILMRTVLYSFGVLVVMILEKGFEGRHEYGSFGSSLQQVFNDVDIYHVWVNTIVVFGTLLGYNLISYISNQLGKGTLLRMLFSSPSKQIRNK